MRQRGQPSGQVDTSGCESETKALQGLQIYQDFVKVTYLLRFKMVEDGGKQLENMLPEFFGLHLRSFLDGISSKLLAAQLRCDLSGGCFRVCHGAVFVGFALLLYKQLQHHLLMFHDFSF